MLSTGALAQALPGASLLAQARAVRANGCEGRAGLPESLHPNDALDAAAARWSHGTAFAQALRQSGYRSIASAAGYARGGPGAAHRLLEGRLCHALLERSLVDFGAVRRGGQTWIVLAAPFVVPLPAAAPQIAAHVLTLTNLARAHARRCGRRRFGPVPPLRLSRVLSRAARGHAEDMLRHDYFSHIGRDGSTPGQRIRAAGYVFHYAGENIAEGPTSAARVVGAWLASPEHCRNIMSPHFAQMGIAYAASRRGPARIDWVQDFGSPASPPPRAARPAPER